MKAGAAKGSAIAGRFGRFGESAKAREVAERQVAAENPLPTEPPDWLDKAAAQIWRENLPRVIGRATESDTETYASWCVAAARVRKYSRGKTAKQGEYLRASQRVALALARDLGLTVVSRSRIPRAEDVDETDAAEAAIAAQLA